MASIITNTGKQIMLDRTYTETPTKTAPKYFKVGSGQATAVASASSMTNPVPISGTDSIDDCETADWTDSADMTTALNSTTYKIGSNSLNLTKDATASATASTYKTTTSINFTSQEFSMWLYILDSAALAKLATSACLTIRLGSDASNYWQWTKDKSALAVGWNLIDGLTTSNGTETGSATLTAMDYTYIGLTATGSAIVWSAGDILMDDLKAVAADDYLKAFTSTTINNSALEVEIRSNLSSLEANGYLLNGFGVVNNDSTKLLFSLDDFTAESKSNTDEFIFITKDKLLA